VEKTGDSRISEGDSRISEGDSRKNEGNSRKVTTIAASAIVEKRGR